MTSPPERCPKGAALRPGLETKAGETWFAQRIGILEDAARRRFDTEPVAFASHLAWIAEATALRAQRNQLVHGRWAIDPHRGMARNLVGVPFGTQTASRDYTPDDLLAFRDRILAASKALDLLPPVCFPRGRCVSRNGRSRGSSPNPCRINS